ncbi:MAG: response regulator, partial [Pyrinomonadaceae bacterium]|nr:response regulator [Pyrinomonadaceae bacterium]
VLDFSKAEAGKVKLEITDFNLREVVNKTIDLFSIEANRKNLSLTGRIDKNVLLSVRGDAGRLRQILNNLIGNALKFTETGGVTLHVEKIEETEQKSVLRFGISDTGIGIAPEVQKTLFEPFTQGDISTTRRFGGTGLGLAICRQLLELMNGEIGIQSALRQGTTFWFVVPFEKSSVVYDVDEMLDSKTFMREVNAKNDLVLTDNVETFDKRKVKILVVEDNIVNQKVAVGMLKNLGYVSDVAENGREAIDAINNNKYDLVLMDCQMPLLDGYEATKEIRRTETPEKRVVIVAMTANASPGEADRCRAIGMDDYLCKPFKKEELAYVLEKHLSANNAMLILDEKKDFVQHQLAGIIEAGALRGLLEIEAREPDFLREMLTLYVSQAQKQLELMREANNNNNLEKLRRAVHNLKGSSGNIGLMNAHKICTDIEENLEKSDRHSIAHLISKTQNIVRNITSFLQNPNN